MFKSDFVVESLVVEPLVVDSRWLKLFCRSKTLARPEFEVLWAGAVPVTQLSGVMNTLETMVVDCGLILGLDDFTEDVDEFRDDVDASWLVCCLSIL